MLDKDSIEVAELSNHLTMITVRQPWARTIHADIFVKLGSADERRPGDFGLCHILEHMVFRGTEEYTEEEIVARTQGRGGYTNANTGDVRTQYHGWAPTESFPELISTLDSVVFRPKLEADVLEIEKKIVLEEIARSRSNPSGVAVEKVFAALLPNHNSSRPTLGSAESVSGMKITRMREYVRAFHRPQTTVLAICGNLPEEAELEAMLYEQARGLVRKTRAANSVVLPRNFGDATPISADAFGEEVWDDIKASTTVTAHFVDRELTIGKKAWAVEVMSDILGGGEFSMMWKEIRQEGGLAYSCHAGNDELPDFGRFMTIVQTRSANVSKVDGMVDDIIKRIQKGKFSEDVIEQSKMHIIGGLRRGFDVVNGVGRSLGEAYCMPEDQRVMPWEIEGLIRKITKKDVAAVADAILSAPSSRYHVLDKGE